MSLSANETGELLDYLPGALFLGDFDGNILDVNTEACQLLGYEKEDLLSLTVDDLVPEGAPAFLPDQIDEATRSWEPIETVNLHRDGTKIPVEVRGRVLEVEGKERLLVSVRDIEERKDAQKELKKSKEKYETYFEKTGDAIFILKVGGENHGKILDANPSAEDQTGYSREELLGMNLVEDIALETEEKNQVEITKRISRGKTVRFTQKKRKKDGSEYWTEVVITPLEHQGQQANLSINRDITERREAQQALRESEQKYRSMTEDVLDFSPAAFFILNSDFKVVWVNKTAEEYFGIDREKVIGKDKKELIEEEIKHIFERPDRFENKVTATYEDNTYVEEFDCHLIVDPKRGIEDRWLQHESKPINSGLYEGGRIEYYTDLTKRKQTERKLQHRAEFEELLREISANFLEAGTGELETAMDEGLARVGEFLEVDRSYVFTFDWDRETMSNTNEWCAEGIEPQIDELQDLPISDFPAWTEELQNSDNIYIRQVSELPDSWRVERENFEALDIQSLVGVPISHGQDLIGFAGFDSVEEERDWKDEDIDLLRILGNLAGHAIYRRRAEEDIRQSRQELQESFVELAETTSRVLGVRDPYTEAHEQRVAELAKEVGRRMGLGEEKLLGLYIGGVLHDIGKIAIPETILTKPGELKEVEWDMIKSHPEVGYNQILEDTDFPWPVAEMTLHHHERLDGSGYPDGLEGDELTTEVRILGAVDVVEAMSTRRPYREARTKERTLGVLEDEKGTKLDPEVVDILVDMIEEGEVEFGER
ncbi:PAS domain S-box protein [Candidatus Bipolaricaulota bacterium]|nr:PAS domain S-box protein [Candidatus Bipolaricaulota bacterium]